MSRVNGENGARDFQGHGFLMSYRLLTLHIFRNKPRSGLLVLCPSNTNVLSGVKLDTLHLILKWQLIAELLINQVS